MVHRGGKYSGGGNLNEQCLRSTDLPIPAPPPASCRTIELCIPFTAKVAESTSPYKGFDTLCLIAPHHTDALRIPLGLWCPALDSCYRPLLPSQDTLLTLTLHVWSPSCMDPLLTCSGCPSLSPSQHSPPPPHNALRPTLLSPTYCYANL